MLVGSITESALVPKVGRLVLASLTPQNGCPAALGTSEGTWRVPKTVAGKLGLVTDSACPPAGC